MTGPPPPNDTDRLANLPGTRRALSAVTLKVSGASYQAIARTLDYPSPDAARQAVELVLSETNDAQNRDVIRNLNGRRLDKLIRSVWGKATDQNDPEHLSAVRTAAMLIDRHIRLYGADAPTELVVHNPAAAEIETWVAQMAQQRLAQLPPEADVIDIPDAEIVADDNAEQRRGRR